MGKRTLKLLGWCMVIIGFLIQIVIPAHIIRIENTIVMGFPAQMGVVFLGVVLALIGFMLIYFSWFEGHTKRIDREEEDKL